MVSNLPTVSVLVKSEIEASNRMMAQLREYQQKFWAIGLNGDTLQPEAFLKFFQDRNLPFDYFVRSTSGVNVGSETAYAKNIATIQRYVQRILATESEACHHVIDSLKSYQCKFWAIGLNGDTLQPDSFVAFFGNRQLHFAYFVRSQGLSLGESTAYDENIATINSYLKDLDAAATQTTSS